MLQRPAPEPTGRDRSLAVLRTREVLSSQRIAGYLNRSGVDGRICDRASAGRAVLLEIEGFVDSASGVLDGLRAAFGLGAEAVTVIGTFPVPPIFGGAAT